MRKIEIALFIVASCVAAVGCNRNSSSDNAPRGVASLSDAEVAGALMSLNLGEVNVARAALPHLQRDDVKMFANQMVQVHSEANATATRQLSARDVTAKGSGLSRALDAKAGASATRLAGSTDAADRAYVDDQVTMHREALMLIDCVLVPNADDATLRTLLTQEVRPTVESHFQHAMQLQTTVAPNTPTAQPAVACAQVCGSNGQTGSAPADIRGVVCRS